MPCSRYQLPMQRLEDTYDFYTQTKNFGGNSCQQNDKWPITFLFAQPMWCFLHTFSHIISRIPKFSTPPTSLSSKDPNAIYIVNMKYGH